MEVSETGPVIPLTQKLTPDFLGPSQGMEANGSGTISVAASGRSGTLNVILPKGDSVFGHWRCGGSALTGARSRPDLIPARTPPKVGECALGSSTSNPPPAVICPNGELNVEARNENGSYVETAGPDASVEAVEADLCRDEANDNLTSASFSLEYEYSVSAVDYGWRFGLTAAEVVSDANCDG
ncbi:MAG: hypothetical protein ACRENX_12415 [Candidatus Dormibacteria bacterium]